MRDKNRGRTRRRIDEELVGISPQAFAARFRGVSGQERKEFATALEPGIGTPIETPRTLCASCSKSITRAYRHHKRSGGDAYLCEGCHKNWSIKVKKR
jgi:hypothetical protein